MRATNTIRLQGIIALSLACSFLLMLMAGCTANGQSSNSTQAASQSTEAAEVIGIIGAMDAEVDSLKSAADAQDKTTIAGMEFCAGAIGEKKVVIVKCEIVRLDRRAHD